MKYITLDELKIASPCHSAEWSELKDGDNYSRLCTTCHKNVYNLSLMTSDEANDLVHAKGGNMCITLYRRFDGTVLTADCLIGLRTLRRQYLKSRAKAIGLALSIWGFLTCTTASCGTTDTGLPAFHDDNNFSAYENDGGMGSTFWNTSSTVIGVNDTSVNEIWINAHGMDNSSMWIFLDSTERTPGTYVNHHGVFPAGGFFNGRDANYWYDGELVIDSINSGHTSGTFWFNARNSQSGNDTVSITGGQFDVAITYGRIPN